MSATCSPLGITLIAYGSRCSHQSLNAPPVQLRQMTLLAASSSAHAEVPAGPPHTMNGFFAIARWASARAATSSTMVPVPWTNSIWTLRP